MTKNEGAGLAETKARLDVGSQGANRLQTGILVVHQQDPAWPQAPAGSTQTTRPPTLLRSLETSAPQDEDARSAH